MRLTRMDGIPRLIYGGSETRIAGLGGWLRCPGLPCRAFVHKQANCLLELVTRLEKLGDLLGTAISMSVVDRVYIPVSPWVWPGP